jgi:enoyl-CoA hydratase/carnithine racemase
MTADPILLEIEGPLARITLNRPAVLNAMDMAWVQGFEAAVAQVATAPGVRVVVVRGAGRAFCSGLDLDMFAREGMPAGFYETQERGFVGLEELDAITIAAIHGYCLGGGVQLAIACDLRVCSADARLGLPAINEGIIPGLAPYRLPRMVGLGAAFRLVVSGEIIDPPEALRLGLVDYLVPAERFEAGLDEIVGTYLKAPPTASAHSKRLLRHALDSTLEEALQDTGEALRVCLASPEAAAARRAWGERKAGRAGRPLA